jgi:hypothetical protein
MLPRPLGEPVCGRDPGEGKRSHRAPPEERRRLRRDVLFRDQWHPLPTGLCSHEPLLFEMNCANGFFIHHSRIAEIALHNVWQVQHLGLRDETRLCLLALLQQCEPVVVCCPGHGSFLPLCSVNAFVAHLLV